MGFLSDLVTAPGLIFGPLMVLAGLVAGGMCARAAARPSRRAARRAVGWSLVPAAVGAVAAAFGAARWGLFYGPTVAPWPQVFGDLLYTALFGALVSAAPLAWAVGLARRAPDPPAGPAAADYDDHAAEPGAAADRAGAG